MLRLLLPALCALAVWPSLSSANDSAPYLLNPGDTVNISVWGEDKLIRVVDVLPDGTISFPLADEVKVAGLDSTQAAKLIAAKLEKFIPDPIVSVVVTNPKGNLVYTQGKVLKPGSMPLAGPTNVLQMLSMAGGLDKFADTSEIKILRNNRVMPVNYSDLVSGRDLSTNYQLQAGDTLVVP